MSNLKYKDEIAGQGDLYLFELKAIGEVRTEQKLLVNKGALEFSDIDFDIFTQGQGVRFGRLIAPLRPLHPAKHGCVEHFFGSLLKKFPELEHVSDEETDRILDRMRRKRIHEE